MSYKNQISKLIPKIPCYNRPIKILSGKKTSMQENKYLSLLAEKYETKDKVASELINLEAILNLPKGTELYISDIHAEYKAFNHIIRSGAGNIKEKIDEIFVDEAPEEMERLAMLIAYPTICCNVSQRIWRQPMSGRVKRLIV